MKGQYEVLSRYAAVSMAAILLVASAAPAYGEKIARNQLTVNRSWGPEQATGAPDTMQDGDIPTAWATMEPDAGVEWLKLEFEDAVIVAEVRIRETYNPGAVVRVEAIDKDNERIVLWEGKDLAGKSPGELVVKPPKKVKVLAKTIKVHLDTRQVPGWNEIDAIELVGADGTRQWASQAVASTTYATYASPQDPLHDIVGRKVTIRLMDEKILVGKLAKTGPEFLVLERDDPRTLLVNRSKIVWIEPE